MPYGISNSRGVVPESEAKLIVDLALKNRVNLYDTAPAYQQSEEILGRIAQGPEYRIVTKTPVSQPGNDIDQVEAIKTSLDKSLGRLNRKCVDGLLIHGAADLFSSRSNLIIGTLVDLKEKGLVKKIGVSVYTAREIDRALELFRPDIVQIPANVFDQRLLASGHVRHLKQLGVEVHIRSIFLQGLILLEPSTLHPYFERFRSHLERFENDMGEANLSTFSAALQFVLQQPDFDRVLVGVTSKNELEQILAEVSKNRPRTDFASFAYDDENVLDPSKWKIA